MKEAPKLFAPGATLRLGVRLSIAGVLLFTVFRVALPEDKGALEAIAGAWRVGGTEAWAWFLLAFTLFGVSFAVGTSRFSLLLRGAGFDVGWGVLFRALLVAGFFNLVLPGAILGDVYRVWDVRREAGEGSRALAVVVVERLLGFAALGCVGLAAAPFVPLAAQDRYLAVALVALCFAIAGANALALHPAANRLMQRLLVPIARFSQRIADAGKRVLAAVSDLAESPRILWRGFVLSLVNQGLPVAAVYCLAVPLVDAALPWYWFAIIVPFVTLMSLIPISIGGTGVREALYVALFGAVGMPAESALALSLSLLGTAIGWALVGFAIFSFDRRHTSPQAQGLSS
ncbi:MAG: flippase-like domain-containing protein [bacterium]|nr:flippase-like domain-containing protein [bacterium]